MYDLLKSMKDVKSAKQLVQNVINMYKSGGFSFTKLMTNSKELLATIPEKKRKEGVKDKGLSEDLPNKKALRICWYIEKDTFFFKNNLDRKPITKTGLLSMISSIYDPFGFAASVSVTNMCNGMKLFIKMFRVIGQSGLSK